MKTEQGTLFLANENANDNEYVTRTKLKRDENSRETIFVFFIFSLLVEEDRNEQRGLRQTTTENSKQCKALSWTSLVLD